MNKKVKYILEQEYHSFNPADLNDGKPKKIQSQDVINDAIYTHHPTTMAELRRDIREVLSSGTTDLNCIDVSKMVTMSHVFDQYLAGHKDGIGLSEEQQKTLNVSNWDVSACKNFNSMFKHCEFFNGDLSEWNTGSGENFSSMFEECVSFNGDLSQWDVCSANNFSYMFQGCTVFNSDLSEWLVGGATDFQCMFAECPSFNCDLSEWDIRLGTAFTAMFRGCKSFNCDLSKWNPMMGKYFSGMFGGCDNLDFDITKWIIDKGAFGVGEMLSDEMEEKYVDFIGFKLKD